MNPYEAKQAARVERMRARAVKLTTEAGQRASSVHKMVEVMNGTPILRGHHSERRHRRDLARMDANMRKSVEASKEAESLTRRADRAESSDAVSSDDPDALPKLHEKLATAEAQHAALVEVNRRLRAGDEPVAVAQLITWQRNPVAYLASWQSLGHKTIPLANASAELRRLKARIAEMEAKASAPPVEPVRVGDVEIREEDNRVRVFFPAKPDEAMRAKLRAAGFIWAGSVGAWQRKASNRAWYEAKRVLGALS